MSTSSYTLRSAELESAINVFHRAFIAMLKVGPGENVDKDDLRATCKAGTIIVELLEKENVPTPGVDTMLEALADLQPHLKTTDPIRADPLIRIALTQCPPSLCRELQDIYTNKKSKASNAVGMEPPAVKQTRGPAVPAAALKTSKPTTALSRPAKTYQELDDESGEDSGDEYVEEVEKSSHPRKVIKTPAFITEEMEDDDEEEDEEEEEKPTKKKGKARVMDGDEVEDDNQPIKELMKEDRHQLKVDAAWKNPDDEDPLVQLLKEQKVMDQGLKTAKDFHVGPFYWGSYTAPLMGGPTPITFEEYEDRRINPAKGYLRKYLLVDVYRSPCVNCRVTGKTCFFGGIPPKALGKTKGKERKNSRACAECRVLKRRCDDKGRSRFRMIIESPWFQDVKKPVGKVKIEAQTPAPRARRAAAVGVTAGGTDATSRGTASLPSSGQNGQLATIQAKIETLETTCTDLALKVVDTEAALMKLIEESEDRMRREVRKVRQQQKTTTAYVNQKTCSAMEALGLLGNSVHAMMENMMDVLEGLPQKLQETIDSIPIPTSVDFDAHGDTSRTDGDELPPIAIIQKLQSDFNRIAQLLEQNLPNAKCLQTVANASRSPTPVPVTQGQQSKKATTTAPGDATMSAAFPNGAVVPVAGHPDSGNTNRDQVAVGENSYRGPPTDGGDTNQAPLAVGGDTNGAPLTVGGTTTDGVKDTDANSTKTADGNATRGTSGHANTIPENNGTENSVDAVGMAPDGDRLMADPGSPLTNTDSVVGSKRKHEEEGPQPAEKKKKKAPAAKKRPAAKRRVPRGKTVDPTPAGDEERPPVDLVEG